MSMSVAGSPAPAADVVFRASNSIRYVTGKSTCNSTQALGSTEMHTLRAITVTRPQLRSPANRRRIGIGAYQTALRNAALAIALAGTAATAHAGVKASAINADWWLQSSAAEAFVPLTTAGAVSLTFNLASPGKKVLTFSAVCAVFAPGGTFYQEAHLDLDIYVNGLRARPTGVSNAPVPDDAFCSHGYTSERGLGALTRASITVPIQGIEGKNVVQIKARGQGGAEGWYLARTSLVIYD
jgi:hypothetical protein